MKWRSSQKGAAAVEFALLALLLLVFVFGIIEFGFLWVQSHYIANAAREGGRVASKLEDPRTGAELTTVQTAIQNYLEGSVVYSAAFVNNCCDSNDNVEIVVAPYTISAAGVDLAAWRVSVTVQSERIWRPVLWPLLNLLPGTDVGEITQITQFAVFASQPNN